TCPCSSSSRSAESASRIRSAKCGSSAARPSRMHRPKPMREFALEVHFSRWEFAARYNLSGSDSESIRIAGLIAMASPEERAEFEGTRLGYTETFGAPALRECIARTYDTVDPSHLLCFAGAEEAIYAAMRVLLDAADHAIVVTPNYQAVE